MLMLTFERSRLTLTENALILPFLIGCISQISGYSHMVTEEFSSHEVTMPQIGGFNHIPTLQHHPTLTKAGHLRTTELTIQAFNKTFHIPLELNQHLFGDVYVEKHFVDRPRPIIKTRHNHTYTNCFYQSTSPQIIAAISTCHGISGYFSEGEETYYISPVCNHHHVGGDTSCDYSRHYVFRQSERTQVEGKCGTDDADHPFDIPELTHLKRIKREIHSPYDATEKSRYMELYIAADKAEFDKHKRNRRHLVHRIKEIINIVNSLYRQLNIYIALVGIEIWENNDRVKVEAAADKTMNNFLQYRKQYINPDHRNDNAQLLSGVKFNNGIVGKAMKEPICTFQYSGGVSVDSSIITKVVAVTLAHEMGHNLGMEHDSKSCMCPDNRCIMEAVSGLNYPTQWSQCSKNYLQRAFDAGMDYCLRDLPKRLYGRSLCGNGFVEDGEQCDCGLVADCNSACCNATTCTLKVNATCATGQCCDKKTCQLLPAATKCRDSKTECDLPEHCTGDKEYCPTDFHIQDGTPCLDNQAYCFNGQCNTYDKQCKLLWGPTARKGDELCYTRLNQEGTGNGNCGFRWLTKTFKACSPADVFCGMLHCFHKAEKLSFWKDSLTYLMPELHITTSEGKKHFCQSAILDVGYHVPDPGLVPDGTKCGNNMMCMNQQCLTKRQLNFPSCAATNCSHNGVCNNFGQCLCECGWSPPFCNTSGNGGSDRSGPVCDNGGGFREWWIILLLFVLLCLGALIFLIVRFRRKIIYWLQEKKHTLTDSVVQAAGRITKRSSRKPPSHPPPSAPIVVTAPPAANPTNKRQSLQRGQSFTPKDISGPIFQSCTIEDKKLGLVELQQPLYENEVFRPGNKRARPPSCRDIDESVPAPPPRAPQRPNPPAGQAGIPRTGAHAVLRPHPKGAAAPQKPQDPVTSSPAETPNKLTDPPSYSSLHLNESPQQASLDPEQIKVRFQNGKNPKGLKKPSDSSKSTNHPVKAAKPKPIANGSTGASKSPAATNTSSTDAGRINVSKLTAKFNTRPSQYSDKC